MLIIHAPNVHTGGGKVLLLNLLASIQPGQPCHAIIDNRLIIPSTSPSHIDYYRIQPSLFRRYKAEILLRTLSNNARTVLCFGNLPPIFSLKIKTVLFLQNRYLVENLSKEDFSWKIRLRLWLEKKWFILRSSNVDEIIVQTRSMSNLVKNTINRPSTIMPILDFPSLKGINKYKDKKYDFIYVSSGEPHKNHKNLIEAWGLLAKHDCTPNLCITINHERYPELFNFISKMIIQYGLNITNVEDVPHKELFQLYECSGCLIFPSYCESFGLPLIEADHMGLPVIASEEDYVRDLLEPVETFNPASPISIARAVNRFMSIDRKLDTIKSSDDLVDYLIK